MPETNRPEEGARLAAAFAYLRLSREEQATLLGIGERQVSRYLSGENAVPTDRMAKVQRTLAERGVPAWFFRLGFTVAPEPEEPSFAERLEALEQKVDSLFKRSAGDAPPAPPGVLPSQPPAARSSQPTPQLSVNQEEQDARPGTER